MTSNRKKKKASVTAAEWASQSRESMGRPCGTCALEEDTRRFIDEAIRLIRAGKSGAGYAALHRHLRAEWDYPLGYHSLIYHAHNHVGAR